MRIKEMTVSCVPAAPLIGPAPSALPEDSPSTRDKAVFHAGEAANARWVQMLARSYLNGVPNPTIVFVTY